MRHAPPTAEHRSTGGGPLTSVDAGDLGRRLPYLPALDGLRTLALAAVLLDHGGVTAVVGGHFGVTVFFVLSGFLVTSLLLEEHRTTGTVALRSFWRRRARRLVPASLACVALVAAYVVFSGDRPPSTVLGDGLASLTWVANWRFVLTHRSYGDLFADPTPFAHLWSLAVEEQFYLALPLAAVIALRGARSRVVGRGIFAGILAATVVASTALLFLSYRPGVDPLRLYYGTDGRVGELAVGALLAVFLVRKGGLASFGRRARAAVDVGAVVAIGAIALATVRWSSTDAGTYRGGFLAVALATAVVVMACTNPTTSVARVLGSAPLPQLGRLTYGAYLFHWPLFLWIDERATGLDGPELLTVRLLATFGLAALCHAAIEQPVRLGRLIPRPMGPIAWANGSVAAAAVLVLATSIALPGPDSSVFASGATLPAPPVPNAPAAPPANAMVPAPPTAVAPIGVKGAGARASTVAAPSEAAPAAPPAATKPARAAGPAPASTTTTVAPAADALRVAIVGDSLANNLGVGLGAWSKGRTDFVAYNLSVPGCPISRGGIRRFPDGAEWELDPECGWWSNPSNDRLANLRAFDPDIVLVEDALNEIVDRKLPEWPDYRHVGDPRFDTWLLNEYRTAASVFSNEGATVVFADAPCADWSRIAGWRDIKDADERVAALNRIYDSIVAATTKVADLNERICPNGEFSDTVEGVPNARPDGFHLVDDASDRLAERWLAPFLREVADAREPKI